MESESDKGGEGRGLPVGWAWSYFHGVASLAKIDGGPRIAEATPDGHWALGTASAYSATPRPGETLLAAAQAAAEAALWACDGYGTGEARGRFVAHGQGFGLPGRWRTKAVYAVEGGHEIDRKSVV